MKVINPGDGYSGIITHTDAWVQTRTQAIYAAPNSGDGTEVALLTTTITPQSAGNIVVCKFFMFGEVSNSNVVFNVSRNDTLLTDSTDGSNNRWAGIGSENYNTNYTDTPHGMLITIADTNSLAVASTYKLLVRASTATARNFYLNRSSTNTGADGYETGLSRTEITEYVI